MNRTKSIFSPRIRPWAGMLAWLALAQTGWGATYTWTAASGNWSDSLNWGAVVPNYPKLAGDVANLSTAASGTRTVTIDVADAKAASVTLGGNAANIWTIDSSNPATNFLTFDNGLSAATLTRSNTSATAGTISAPVVLNSLLNVDVASTSGGLTISGAVSGAGGLTKKGDGTLTLSGANSYQGVTTVERGILAISHANALGSTSAGVVVQAPTASIVRQLQVSGAITVAENLTLEGNTGATVSLLHTGASATTWSGDITANFISGQGSPTRVSNSGTGKFTISGDIAIGISSGVNNELIFQEGDIEVSGNVSGGQAGVPVLTRSNNTATLTLSGTNTYLGYTRVNGGTLNVTGGAAIPNGSQVFFANPTISTTINIQQSETVGSLNSAATSGTHSIVIRNGSTLTIGGDNSNQSFNGVISQSAGTGSLTKIGSGTQIFTNANTYAGTTTVSAGALQIGNAGTTGALGAGNVVINAQLIYNRSDNITFANNLSGSGTFTKDGAGVAFTGTNSGFAGTVDINTSQLTLAGLNAGSAAAAWNLNASGASLAINGDVVGTGKVLHVGALSGVAGSTLRNGGVSATANTFSIGALGTSTTFAGNVIDTSATTTTSIIKVGAGTLTFSGANSYTGTTTINAGTLRVNGTHTTAGAYQINSGGTLGGSGSISGANTNITLAAGGKISPGNSPGTLTLSLGAGTLNLSAASTGALVFEIGAIGASDQVVLTSGTLNIGSLRFDEFSFIAVSGIELGTYKLFDGVALTGSVDLLNNSGFVTNGQWGGYIWTNASNDVMLTLDFTAVPEPSTLLLAALGAVGFFHYARRRRKP